MDTREAQRLVSVQNTFQPLKPKLRTVNDSCQNSQNFLANIQHVLQAFTSLQDLVGSQ